MAAVIILERALQQSEGLNIITVGGEKKKAGHAPATGRSVPSDAASNHLTLLALYHQSNCCKMSPLCARCDSSGLSALHNLKHGKETPVFFGNGYARMC